MSVVSIAFGASIAHGDQGDGSAAPADDVTVKTFTSAANGGVSISISEDGNITSYQSPTGAEHIRSGAFVDGYVLCYNAVDAFDLNDGGVSGWGSSSHSFPSGTTMRVIRTTSDGAMRLTQDFTFGGSNHTMAVKSTLTNLSAATVANVIFRRHSDFDANGSTADLWGRTVDAVSAWDDAAPGILLRNQAFPSSAVRTAKVVDSISDSSCSPVSKAPVAGADDAATIQYNFGNVASGKAKSVTTVYQGI